MLVEAIENVEFHVLDDLIEAACELMANLDRSCFEGNFGARFLCRVIIFGGKL